MRGQRCWAATIQSPTSAKKCSNCWRGPSSKHIWLRRVLDRDKLREWFEDQTPLNSGKVVPAITPNTDFFPRDEYYLNRP